MSAQKDNKYAQKWTVEAVAERLVKIEEHARQGNTEYLTESLTDLGISPRAWSYWKNKFTIEDEIMDHISLIEGIFEVKLLKAATRHELPPAVTIFALKNNHHWTDRQQPEPVAELPARMPMLVELDDHRIIAIP